MYTDSHGILRNDDYRMTGFARIPTSELGSYHAGLKLGSVTDDRDSFMTDQRGITTRLMHSVAELNDTDDGWSVVGLDATVRTNLSRDEHELILAVREYNTAKDASDEAEAVLETARELADDARFERDDAQADFSSALHAVKHGGSYGY